MSHFPPESCKEWRKILKKLNFYEVKRIGLGKHAHKFKHTTRTTSDYRVQPDFIIIPHKVYPALSAKIVKEVMFFGFSLDEIKIVSK
jgi:hypothetical protein